MLLDPTHPATEGLSSNQVHKKQTKAARAKTQQRTPYSRSKFSMPSYKCSLFRMVAAPRALLYEREISNTWPFDTKLEPWDAKVDRAVKQYSHLKEEAAEKNKEKGKEKEEPGCKAPEWQSVIRNVDAADTVLLDEHDPLTREYISQLQPAISRTLARQQLKAKESIGMSLAFSTNKAKMGGHPIYASKVKHRVRAIIRLIVRHGAKVEQLVGGESKKSNPKIVFDLEEVKRMGGRGWLLKDWAYLLVPTLSLYRMPYHDLIPKLREALSSIYKVAAPMEEQWMRTAVEQRVGGQVKPKVKDKPKVRRRGDQVGLESEGKKKKPNQGDWEGRSAPAKKPLNSITMSSSWPPKKLQNAPTKSSRASKPPVAPPQRTPPP